MHNSSFFSPLFLCFIQRIPGFTEHARNGIFLSENAGVAFKAGYEGDFTLGRNLSSSSFNNPGLRAQFNAGTITLGFVNRIELYSCLGSSYAHLTCDTKTDEKISFKTDHNFGGEVGFRANTPIFRQMKFGVDAKYFYAWPTLSSIDLNGESLAPEGRVFQKEWQVGIGFSQTFAFFTPYVGVKFSKFSLEFVDLTSVSSESFSDKVEVHNKNPFGLFIGMGISGKKAAYFDFEARFIDEYALTGALGLSF